MTTEERARLTYNIARIDWQQWTSYLPSVWLERDVVTDVLIQAMESVETGQYAGSLFAPYLERITMLVLELYPKGA